jgi:hypothetical protein
MPAALVQSQQAPLHLAEKLLGSISTDRSTYDGIPADIVLRCNGWVVIPIVVIATRADLPRPMMLAWQPISHPSGGP